MDAFSAMQSLYIKDNDVALFVFSPCQSNSLSELNDWLAQVRDIKPNLPVILVGTRDDVQPSGNTLLETADNSGLPLFKVSSKNNTNISELWQYAISKAL